MGVPKIAVQPMISMGRIWLGIERSKTEYRPINIPDSAATIKARLPPSKLGS